MEPSDSPSNYSTTVDYSRYIPENGGAPKLFDNSKYSENGKYWETLRASQTLKVNPEVLMSYDDTSGNTSLAFTAGDKLRELQPITFNRIQYVNTSVNSKLTGVTTATDASAKKLQESLGFARDVVYKGSPVAVNHELIGDLELKTFALDIGASYLKSTWNPATTYSTDPINEEFLTRHAVKNPSGTWSVTFDAEGKLLVGSEGTEYAGQKDKLTVEQRSVNVTEHILVIRGGKLHSVDRNSHLSSLSTSLTEALVNMKIAGDDNIFNNFERGKGAALSEGNFASLGNALRGTSDLTVGSGWYNEDTSVLVVREYTNTFTLPHYMYSDKIPMEITGVSTQSDKTKYFSEGKLGYLRMTYKLGESFLTANTLTGEFTAQDPKYIIPNVSVLDSFGTVQ
ncbi:hypothetical protein D3C71_1253690 [compost metagenome]